MATNLSDARRKGRREGVPRRDFLGGTAALAGAALLPPALARATAVGSASSAGLAGSAAPEMPAVVEQRMKRWQEQRWLLDAVIQVIGVEWDQGRIAYTLGPCGPDATADFSGVRTRVRKYNDITREFTRAAKRREAMAQAFEADRRLVAARESYFIASLLYGSAQWPIFANTRENLALNEKKVGCYKKYIEHADHEIRAVEVPFEGKSLPGYFHLPKNRPSGRLPCVFSIGGMDSFKEMSVSLYGDKMLERGAAVLALEGPGQGECCTRDIHATATNWIDAGRAVFSWIRSQREVDPDRVAVQGVSMGSFWGTQVASADDHLKGCSVMAVCHEPGGNTIFNMASPTFKLRFMYMAGYQDEAEFDKFAKTLSLRGVAEKITCPYLVVAGEDDQLSPIEYTYDLLDRVTSPKQLVVYEGADHGAGGSTASALGPGTATLVAEWLTDRLAGKKMETQHIRVDMAGQTHVSSFEEARRSLMFSL